MPSGARDEEGRHLVLNVDPGRLRQLGGFPPDRWPLVDTAGGADLNRYLSFASFPSDV